MSYDSPDNLEHELAAELPSHRDDEPSSLRQDILDELSDHLTCAMQREQLRAGRELSATELWKRVIDRFGHPAQLARQLWLQAMREKIIMQKLTSVLLAILFIGMGYMLWRVSLMNSHLQRALQAQLAESRQMQQDLMEKLLVATSNQSSNLAADEQPAEWNNLSVKVVYDDAEQTPVVGAQVSFRGMNEHTKSIPPASEQTDATGIADLGTVIYGEYFISLTAPNGVELTAATTSVRPGSDRLFEVTVPKSSTVPVKFVMDLPENLHDTLSIEPDRIWHLISLMTDGNWPSSPIWKSVADPQSSVQFLIGSQGLCPIDFMTLEQDDRFALVHWDEHLDGLLSDQDRLVYDRPRSGDVRLMMKGDIPVAETVDLPLGRYESYWIQTYVEMKLSDGRRILLPVPDPLIPDVFDWKDSEEAIEQVQQQPQVPSAAASGMYLGNTGPVLSDFLLNQNRSEYAKPSFYVVPQFDLRSLKKAIHLQPDYSGLGMMNFLTSLPKEVRLVSVHATEQRERFSFAFGKRRKSIEIGSIVNLAEFDPRQNPTDPDPDSVLVENGVVLGLYQPRKNRGRSGPTDRYLMSLSDVQIKSIQDNVDPAEAVTPYALRIDPVTDAESATRKE